MNKTEPTIVSDPIDTNELEMEKKEYDKTPSLSSVTMPKSHKPWRIMAVGVLIVLILGFFLIRLTTGKKSTEMTKQMESELDLSLPEVDKKVRVNLTKSNIKENTMVLSIEGLEKEYESIAYELSYESQGVIQGVTSKPLDVSGKDSFLRDDIYLGTCSKNVCRPHSGVKKITVVLEFTKTDGKKYSFSQDFDL